MRAVLNTTASEGSFELLAGAASLPAPESFVEWCSTASPLVHAGDRVGVLLLRLLKAGVGEELPVVDSLG